ncbi:MAG: hypothetical protein FWE06_04035 [Oscillospiraceae bacterium]|nr:hypothetical protein [Oscillospiraceae bacterium]
MKKILTLSLCLVFMLAILAACNGDSGGAGNNVDVDHNFANTGAMLTAIIEEANANLDDFDMLFPSMMESFPNEWIGEDEIPVYVENQLGITMTQFENDVVNVSHALSMIATLPQEAFLFETENAADAARLAGALASGFDPRKWICVSPDWSMVMQAGNYVLLASGKAGQRDALAAAFNETLGVNVTANVFFEWDGEVWWDEDPDGGFGFGGGMEDIGGMEIDGDSDYVFDANNGGIDVIDNDNE